ncbi:DNA mismatch repair protein mutL [Phlyctema vagabunda]|uniref:DNA mismatch repair protein mutL n=1 Tax=Phlyctema vagabunda TaxID=108571 RepID=A0ABR4PNG5_9HELO
MPISALPPATVHLLGSAQVLTTSNSLVKELIDNALDAKASSIDILISPDTLEKIEVRDNGHGIANEDLDLLGRRGHTSKLRSFEELKHVGGTTLGFRGEALASAVELGEVTITSRTDGEPVGTVIKLKTPTGASSQSKASHQTMITQQSKISHPIGTTVSVAKFMANLPIRKQQALKQATKTLAKLKDLLQSYALARPSVRFNLRITKGSKGGWSFSPRPNDGIREAVSQVIGRDAAMQCIVRSVSPNDGDAHQISSKNTQFQLDAFLPKPDADASKIGSGQYLCIDARPLSSDKGTIKKIVTLLKKYLRASLGNTASDKIKNPFFRLSITCAKSSYDPNVEPAKDDVIFENEDMLIESVEELFKEVYGDCVPIPSNTPAPRVTSEKLDNFELLLNRKCVQETGSEVSSSNMVKSRTAATIGDVNSRRVGGTSVQHDIQELGKVNKKRKSDFDMSKDFAGQVDGSLGRPGGNGPNETNQVSTEETQINPASELNPWVIAKINTPLKPEKPIHQGQTQVSSELKVLVSTIGDPEPRSRHAGEALQTHVYQPQLDTVNRSISPPIPVINPRLSLNPDSEITEIPRPLVTTNEEEMLLGEHTPPRRPALDFISARQLPQISLMTPPSTQHSSVKKIKGPNRPFVSPLGHAESNIAQKGVRQVTLDRFSGVQTQNNAPKGSSREPDNDLDWAMDFENRKEEATRHRREELRAAKRKQREEDFLVADIPRSSPHQNRYNAAIATLETPQEILAPNREKSTLKTVMKDGDPRAYLMRRQKSMSAQDGVSKMKRLKTSLLPMENIPETSHMYNVAHTVSTSESLIRNSLAELTNFDNYASRGVYVTGLDTGAGDKSPIVSRLKKVVDVWKNSQNENEIEVAVEYKLNDLLEGNVTVVS